MKMEDAFKVSSDGDRQTAVDIVAGFAGKRYLIENK